MNIVTLGLPQILVSPRKSSSKFLMFNFSRAPINYIDS